MTDQIPPTPKALQEALALSEEILKDIELSRGPLSAVALKAGRLARLLNHFDAVKVFQYEASGYPSTPDGIAADVWRFVELGGRTYQERESKSKEVRTLAFVESIDQLEHQLEAA